jgi:hypothetical protein
MTAALALPAKVWRQTLKVATAFWGVCLGLVAIDATIGANVFTALAFFISVPILVGYLMWANRDLLILIKRGFVPMVAFGVYVLCSASAIVFVGLFAAANLKSLIAGA